MDTIKKITIGAAFFIFFITAVINITRQGLTLIRARQEIERMEKRIVDLKTEKDILEKKVEISTSSAYIQREIRDKLAMGREGDVRIILPENYSFEELYPKVQVGDEKAVFSQWIDLFTGK